MANVHTKSAHNKVILAMLTSANKTDDMLGKDTGSETWSTSSPLPRAGRNKVAGASLFGDRVSRLCFWVVGVAVTSTAATALAAGTPTPATSFALFVLLLVGLSLVSLSLVIGGASGRGCGGDDDVDVSFA